MPINCHPLLRLQSAAGLVVLLTFRIPLPGKYLSVCWCNPGENDDSMDQLSFETLISTTLLARYMSVLMQYRRLVVCGPSGTGKTHLALALARSVVRRSAMPALVRLDL